MTQNLRHLAETLLFHSVVLPGFLTLWPSGSLCRSLEWWRPKAHAICPAAPSWAGVTALVVGAETTRCELQHARVHTHAATIPMGVHFIAWAAALQFSEPRAQIPLTVSKHSHNKASDIDGPRTHAAVMAQGSTCRTPCHGELVMAASAKNDVSRLCSMLPSLSCANACQV